MKFTTYSAKPSEITRKWYLIDATDLVLGRVSAHIATLLKGKHKPMYSTNLDCGDHVIVINADKIYMPENKQLNKKYYHHTGYPGGLKETTAKKLLNDPKKSTRVLTKAVERMISRNCLGRKQMLKLHVYNSSTHPHAGQKPELLDFAALNKKNKRDN